MLRKHLASTVLATALSFSAAHATTVVTTTINAGGSSLAYPTYAAEFAAYTKTYPTVLFSFAAVGSGSGQTAFLNNDITQFTNAAAGTLKYGTVVGTTVSMGASDATLSTPAQLTAPATGSYAKSSVAGPLIQLPTLGVPITMAFNSPLPAAATATTKAVYGVPTAGLALTDAQICGVLSGKINDWHTLVAAIPANTTINVTYRSDSSGTTFLLTQHLHAVCTTANSNFPTLPVAITKTFAGLFTAAVPVPGNFTPESGSGGVAGKLVATANSLGYLSPDYTSIAPLSASTTALRVASVYNGSVAYKPTVANTELALENPGAGSTNPTAPATLANAMNPMNWVPAMPIVKTGYPIVGFTTVDVSTCYANATAGTAINNFLTANYKTAAYQTIISNNGFAPLSATAASPFVVAIVNTFLTNTAGYNLNIDNTKTCASYAGR